MDKGYSGLNPYKSNNNANILYLAPQPIRSYSNVATIKMEDLIGEQAQDAIKGHPFSHPKYSPVKVPIDATVKKKSKNGYEQVKYTWRKGQYKYEARWHTATHNAPDKTQSWVVTRTKVGKGASKPITMVRSGNKWVSWNVWQNAIKARRNGVATKTQIKLLNEGHFTRKRGK